MYFFLLPALPDIAYWIVIYMMNTVTSVSLCADILYFVHRYIPTLQYCTATVLFVN